MLLSRKLLNNYVDISELSTEALVKGLTEAGIEVEGVSPLIHGTNLVVGKVLECEKHPDSDKLSVCKVDIGASIEQIVCGAPNVAKGQTVVVATVGAELKDLTIKPTEIRGVASNGMICSLKELGVNEKQLTEKDNAGIVVLTEGEPGGDVRKALGMDDEILDIDLTPNRSDFLSIFSAAHEVAALFEKNLTLPNFEGASEIGSESKLKIHSDTDKCTYFSGKVINKVTLKESPKWIKDALNASGIRAINNVVDISNLVMLETGQPLHFYDIDFLKLQDLSVRNDLEIEVAALDEKTYKIEKGDMLIMNGETPVGIAGIMGLGNSMIHSETRGLIIEVASFDMVSVRKTASRLGLSTESSQRFSKVMDPMAPIKAMDRAVDLLIQYANATEIEETVVFGHIEHKNTIATVSFTKVNAYLGTDLSLAQVVNVFDRLNLNPSVDGDIITCEIPSYRNDLKVDVDLIEEVIRVIGYDILEETLPTLGATSGNLSERQTLIQKIEKILLGFGATQTLTYTLVEKGFTEGSEALENPIKLLSPMSDKRAYLRSQLWPSLLETVSYNTARRIDHGLYFEISKVYAQNKSIEKLIIVGQGTNPTLNWTKESIKMDFYALKGIFIELMEHLGFTEKRIGFVADNFDTNAFHPFKSASVTLDRKRIGILGHVHPKVLEAVDIKDLVVLEIDLADIMSKKKAAIKSNPISPYPNVTRDLSILIDKNTMAQDLIQSIEKSASRLLKGINVFDVYESKSLQGLKSIAIEITFGADHTLSENEITEVMERIKTDLITKLNVTIR